MRKWWIDNVEERVCARVDHPKVGLDTMPWPDNEKVHIAIDFKEYLKLEKELDTLKASNDYLRSDSSMINKDLQKCQTKCHEYYHENESLKAQLKREMAIVDMLSGKELPCKASEWTFLVRQAEETIKAREL